MTKEENRNRKVSHKVYEAWEYDREIDDLNKASQEGWQLEKGGCFHSVFVRDDSVRYIYQLDFRRNFEEDKERYLEVFAEQGWEYINSTFNGWHYFRKRYQEGMDEDEKNIYTDKQSLYEMQNRFITAIKVLAVLYAVMAVMYLFMGITQQAIPILIEGIVFVVGLYFMGVGVCNMIRKRKGMPTIPNLPFIVAFPLMILFLLLALLFL